LKDAADGHGVWDEEWVHEGWLEVVRGDLDQELFGLGRPAWKQIAEEVDVVIHNGALVHWVYPYEQLHSVNVLGTLTALELVVTGAPKLFVFVSSTSAIDTEHYVKLSDLLVHDPSGLGGVPKSDDLEGARTALKMGYGQSKWVSEKLLFEAGQRGLRGHILHPGYVVGNSQSAVTITDDFLWQMVKGCVQLELVPDINSTVNMVPVNHVAHFTALTALELLPGPLCMLHVAAHPRPTFNTFLGTLAQYGFGMGWCEYLVWRRQLKWHVM
ncbi:male sterility protein-domain-containing protein, partial [Amylocystis lapponica]